MEANNVIGVDFADGRSDAAIRDAINGAPPEPKSPWGFSYKREGSFLPPATTIIRRSGSAHISTSLLRPATIADRLGAC